MFIYIVLFFFLVFKKIFDLAILVCKSAHIAKANNSQGDVRLQTRSDSRCSQCVLTSKLHPICMFGATLGHLGRFEKKSLLMFF